MLTLLPLLRLAAQFPVQVSFALLLHLLPHIAMSSQQQ
jgi:hypothetical protein